MHRIKPVPKIERVPKVARAFMLLNRSKVDLHPGCADRCKFGQQGVVEMGIMREPIVDQCIATHIRRYALEHRCKPVAQRRTTVDHIMPMPRKKGTVQQRWLYADIAFKIIGPTA